MFFLVDGFLRMLDMLLRLTLPNHCKKISFVTIYSGSQINMTQLVCAGPGQGGVKQYYVARRATHVSCQLEIAKSFLILGNIYIVWPKGRMGSMPEAPRGHPYICTSFGGIVFHYFLVKTEK